MKADKKSILLAYDKEELIEFRKILFKKGISVQEFFGHIMHCCIMHDNNIETFYEKIIENKKELAEKGGELKNYKLDDVDAMYEAIENHLKRE